MNSVKDNVAAAPAVEPSADFVPTKMDKFLGYFVGANYAPHYTRHDVNQIRGYSALTFVSVGMATTGAAMALSTGLGVSPFLSVVPFAALFTQMDRTFVRMEVTERADAHIRSLEELYPNPSEPAQKIHPVRRFFNRAFPVSLRMSMAIGTSLVTGGVLIEQMAQPEIQSMAKSAVARHNQSFVALKDQEESAYDARTEALRKAVDDGRKGLLTTSLDVAPAARLPADQDKYDRAKAAFDALAVPIAQAQRDYTRLNNLAIDEGNGVEIPGKTTGQPSCKKQCLIDKSNAEKALAIINQLRQRQAEQQAIMDGVAKKDQQSVNEQKALATKNAGDRIAATKQFIPQWLDEIKQREHDRAQKFADIEKRMRETPGYITEQAQRGLFSDMYLFGKFQDKPGGGAQAKALAYTTQVIVFLFEMAAVLGAASRPITPSEKRDAEIRAAASSDIRRRVRSRRQQDILEERAFNEAVRSSTRSSSPPNGAKP